MHVYDTYLNAYLMSLGRPIGVRLLRGLGRVLRMRMDETFPCSPCFVSIWDGEFDNCILDKK